MTEASAPTLMWFRQDLRLLDNPAVCHAAEAGRPVVAVYIHDEQTSGIRPLGAAQKWWLNQSLKKLNQAVEKKGNHLIFRSGPADRVIDELVKETGAASVVWNRRYGESEEKLDASIKSALTDRGIEAKSFKALLMHEPALVRTKTGNPYKVYTPFWKTFRAEADVRQPLPAPGELKAPDSYPKSDDLASWGLHPSKPDWSGTIADKWTPGEDAAQEQMEHFLADDLRVYDEARDHPGPDRTSRLSPYLRFGEISPFQLWHAAHDQRRTAGDSARETWVKELVWREFSYHLLHNFQSLHEKNFNEKFDAFPWANNASFLTAWQTGKTGYPIVDAGMRQLYQTGWMHNRVRMIVGSFLVKHLLIDWREGERWFWDCLVDGDPASNPAQWQWVAGSGADAAPYFRIFNPMMQSEKFDKKGEYIRQYIPELAQLPDKHIHMPWEAPLTVLRDAGVKLGDTYPMPIVDHKTAREKALAALNETKG
ncbi:cryptochrome/photolyase family protein [Pseudahrensia aquimaris]|uniref:Cryptochrome/photolyase family protein n=1 Tax=Pseudahrensia aquimaris TaxID=744461 RepID=A0ABW3FH61_9HYPH